MDAKTRHLIGKSSEETSIRDIDIRDRLRARKAIPKKAVPKTAVSRPIIEFDEIESFFALVYSRPFWEQWFWDDTPWPLPLIISLRKNHMEFTCGLRVLFQFHMFFPHVSAMLRDRSRHEPHMWPHVESCGSHVGHTTSTCVCRTSHVSHVKNLHHMWTNVWNLNNTRGTHVGTHVDRMWATCGFNVIFP